MILLKKIATIKIATFVVKAFFIGLFFCALGLSLLLIFISHENFTQYLMEYYGKQDKLEVFRTSYLTANRYLALRMIALALTFLSALVLLTLKAVSDFLSAKLLSFWHSLNYFSSYLLEYFRLLSFSQKSLFAFTMLLIAIVKWIFLNRYCLHIDELFSYVFFVRKGFWVLISYYPGPNNHILYSLTAYLLQPFIKDPFYLMKIPSLVASVFASCFFFFFALRYFSFRLSLLGTLLLSFWGNFFFYSLLGRGYVLMSFFTMVAAFLILEISSGKKEKFFWHLYVLFSLLAFYAMLVYLYPFITFGLITGGFILYRKEYAQLKPWFFYNSMIVLGTVFLYAPILLVSGLSAITSNPWSGSISSQEFFRQLPLIINTMFDYILYLDQYGLEIGLFVLFGATYFLVKEKKIPLLVLIWSLFVTPLLVLMIQQARPFDRVWTYLVFPFTLCLVIWLNAAYSLIKKAYAKNILSILLYTGFTSYTIWLFYNDTNHGSQIYDDVGRISSEVVEQGNGLVYTNEDVYNIYIRYQSAIRDRAIVPEMSALPETKPYQYVLLVPGTSFPASIPHDKYQLKECNEAIEVYRLKE